MARWYNPAIVRQAALAVLVGLLTFNVSGVVRLIANEPCAGLELTKKDDHSCPPTCARCGCCAQSVEPVPLIAAGSVPPGVPHIVNALPSVPTAHPRDILHVPKPVSV